MYALVIDAYRSLDRYEDAFKCFLMLRDEGIVPNCRLTTATLANIYADMTSEGAGNVNDSAARRLELIAGPPVCSLPPARLRRR